MGWTATGKIHNQHIDMCIFEYVMNPAFNDRQIVLCSDLLKV